jgi:hypothetical protein
MPTAVGGNNAYPSMELICDLVRSMVQDDMAGATGTVGEGQILVDNLAVSVTLGNFFNSALRKICRRLRTSTGPMLIRDNYVIENLPVVNSNLGASTPNPAVQVSLGFTGFFDGLQMHSGFILPVDCLMVEEVWERATASNRSFHKMGQPPFGLRGRNQHIEMHEWEWRGDQVVMPGSLQNRDIRLRYQGKLLNLYQKNVDLSNTFVPILDCEEAMANEIARLFASRQGSEQLPTVATEAEASIKLLCLEQTKRNQGMEYEPTIFGQE